MQQRRRVRQGGQVLADLLRVVVVVLELDPLRLVRQSEKLDQEGGELGVGHEISFVARCPDKAKPSQFDSEASGPNSEGFASNFEDSPPG